jgi:single-strand DNA-binding protein
VFHSITILGRLGGDPQMRFTADGNAVTTMSIAVDDGFGDHKKTVWYRVTAWRQTAEACNQYLAKGSLVLCVGRMRPTAPWQDREGNWRSSLEMTADRVQFVQTQRGGQGAGGSDGQRDDGPEAGSDAAEEEIPF